MTRPDDAAAVAAPRRPHDDLTFDELATRYNFEQTSNDPLVLTRLVMKECEARPRPIRVLDVGCGRGIARNVDLQWAIRAGVDEYWGLEPDASIRPREGLFDRHVTALLEDADLPDASFDVVYSAMVMEHVADPGAFMATVDRILKPGGVYLFITPNRRHYFTRIASFLHAVRLDELVLRIVKGKTVDEYHYPVQYKFNDERQVAACVQDLGFEAPRFAYLEAEGPRGYFPRPLRFVFHALAAKRRLLCRPRSLLVLVGRLEKRGGGVGPPVEEHAAAATT